MRWRRKREILREYRFLVTNQHDDDDVDDIDNMVHTRIELYADR